MCHRVKARSDVIREQIVHQTLSFLAFRSLYGLWVTPNIFVAASVACASERIARLLPDRAGDALEVARQIFQAVGKS